MAVTFRKAERKQAKLRLGVSGPAGAGKTMSSLLVAMGVVGPKGKIALVDSEHRSADLYSHVCDFDKIDLEAPFTPDKYIEAIRAAEEAGYDIVILDSLSHAWAGEGGILDIQGKITDSGRGNSFTAWRFVTPKHNALVEAMLQSKCHVIATMRSKMEYTQQDNGGKKEIKKLGLAPIQRDGMEYEFTVFMDITQDHHASTTKDRTSLFDGKIFKPGIETGRELKAWLESGALDVDATAEAEATPVGGPASVGSPAKAEKKDSAPELVTTREEVLQGSETTPALDRQALIGRIIDIKTAMTKAKRRADYQKIRDQYPTSADEMTIEEIQKLLVDLNDATAKRG